MAVVVSLVSGPKRKLRLYIAGEAPGTVRARTQCRVLQLPPYEVSIEEIDVLACPGLAEAAGILATPTLSDESLSPPRRIVGDLSDAGRVLDFFGIDRETSK